MSEWRNTFQTIPFDRYAGIFGALTTVVCLGVGTVGIFINQGFWHVLAAIYTVAVGFLVAVIELPALYCHSYAAIKFKDRLIEDTVFHHGWIRASLYVACTPAMLGFASILIWPGIQLLITAVLYILVSIKYRLASSTTYANLERPSYSRVPTNDPPTAASNVGGNNDEESPSFGTFTL